MAHWQGPDLHLSLAHCKPPLQWNRACATHDSKFKCGSVVVHDPACRVYRLARLTRSVSSFFLTA